MFQTVKASFYRIVDFFIRLKSILISEYSNKTEKDSLISDSQMTLYEKCVNEINKSNRNFLRFRRFYNFRSIVDTVTYSQGNRYLKRITEIKKNRVLDFNQYKNNDIVGKPVRYKYPSIGHLSPTTLRYVSVALEIENCFGTELSGNFVEVGAGYGGQCVILNHFFKIDNYGIFDLESVQELTKKYLKNLNECHKTTFYQMTSYEIRDWDLAISNYAFSELPTELQMWYVKNVFRHSKRGYLIMNSGNSDFTGRNKGKMSLDDLRRELPMINIIEEKPNTGPDNYVLIWGKNG